MRIRTGWDVKVGGDRAQRILDCVAKRLPEGVEVRHRRGRGFTVLRRKPEHIGFSTAAFGRIPSHASVAEGDRIALARVLRETSDFLRHLGSQWPGLEPGPVQVKARVDAAGVVGTIVDVQGGYITVGPIP